MYKLLRIIPFAALSLASIAPISAAPSIASAKPFELSPADLLAEASANSDKNADATILLVENHWAFHDDGSAQTISHVVFLLRTADAVQGWSSVGQRWEPWHQQRPVIRARVITPDGIAHELDPTTVVDAPAGAIAPDTFSDLRVVRGPLPAVQAGSVVEEEIRQDYQTVLQGEANRVFFGSLVPVRLTRVSFDYPQKLPFQYSVYLLPNAKTTQTAEAGIEHLTIESGPSDPLQPSLPMLPFEAQRWPNVVFSTGDSWAGIAHRYSELIERQMGVGLAADAHTFKNADERKATIATLVRKLHEQVRYTGVEFGDAAIVPAKPADTLSRKYGDCKDKAALLVSMLHSAGIPSYLALLSAGQEQDVDPKHPGIGMFNHAIVYVPGEPDLWIDATADTTTAGSVPAGDQGRLALIIAPGTADLKRIPDEPSSMEVSRETRAFFLPEEGKARVVETTEGEGNADASLRALLGFAEREDMAKNLRSYMRAKYLSDADLKIEHTNREDYSRPFQIKLEIPEAGRGVVNETSADVYIPVGDLFSSLPVYFRTEDQTNPDPGDAKRAHERTEDFVLPEAFRVEWHYRIELPPGDQVKKIPDDENMDLGGAKYSAHFKFEAGLEYADFSFDTVKRRFTVQEAAALKTGIVALLKRPDLQLTFEPTGNALLEAGKIKEALTVFSNSARLHPASPVYHVQMSLALLAAGCGEQARAEAQLATDIASKSLMAWRNLGFVRLHDLIGRQEQLGWDKEGAQAAFKRALDIDPKDSLARRNLSVALEQRRGTALYG